MSTTSGTTYGAYITIGSTGGGGWRARGIATIIEETDTTVTFTITCGIHCNGNRSSSYWYAYILNSSGSQLKASGKFSKSISDGDAYNSISYSVTVNKTASQQTLTYKAQIKNTGDTFPGTSTATCTITVIALTPVTITYYKKDGTTVHQMQDAYKDKAIATLSSAPLETGWTFNSWNTSPDGSGIKYTAGSNITPSEDTSLYAIYTNNYVAPSISNVTAYRVNSSGQAVTNGLNAFASCEITGGTSISTTVVTASVNTSPATSITMTKSGNVYSGYANNSRLSLANSYTVQLTATIIDAAGVTHTVTVSTYITAEIPIIDVSENGNCVAFGKTATDEQTDFAVEIGGDVNIDGDLNVSGPTSLNGTAISGNATASGVFNVTGDLQSDGKTLGALYKNGTTFTATVGDINKGTLSDCKFYQWGNVVQLSFSFNPTASVSAGSVAWRGTFSEIPSPRCKSKNYGYNASRMVSVNLGTDLSVGITALVVQITTSDSFTLDLVYITNTFA